MEINTEEEWRFRRRQQSNYEVLLQVLSLRIQPMNISTPEIKTKQLLSNYKFNKKYKGKHTVWVLKFESESVGALMANDDPIGALYQDCNNVPMLKDLTETAQVNGHFNCSERNIYFDSVNK
jgi:ABC-type microcin C transport system permease subunit YejE